MPGGPCLKKGDGPGFPWEDLKWGFGAGDRGRLGAGSPPQTAAEATTDILKAPVVG